MSDMITDMLRVVSWHTVERGRQQVMGGGLLILGPAAVGFNRNGSVVRVFPLDTWRRRVGWRLRRLTRRV